MSQKSTLWRDEGKVSEARELLAPAAKRLSLTFVILASGSSPTGLWMQPETVAEAYIGSKLVGRSRGC